MRKIWVLLLVSLALVVGAGTGLVYGGVTGSTSGFRIACALLDTAQNGGVLTGPERSDVVARVIRGMRDHGGLDPMSASLIEQMKTGCPQLPRW